MVKQLLVNGDSVAATCRCIAEAGRKKNCKIVVTLTPTPNKPPSQPSQPVLVSQLNYKRLPIVTVQMALGFSRET